MKPIIVLNGPPGCGKDTIANRLTSHQFVSMSFKAPMFKIAKDVLGPNRYIDFVKKYNNRSLKEKVWPLIGMSPRQFMIHISEDFVKPLLGQTAFGYLAAEDVKVIISDMPWAKGVVFSDGGFPSELKDLNKVEGTYPFVVRLFRPGYDFEGDSRSYMETSDLDIVLVEDKPHLAVLEILEALDERL